MKALWWLAAFVACLGLAAQAKAEPNTVDQMTCAEAQAYAVVHGR